MGHIHLDTRPLPQTLWTTVFGNDHPVTIEIGSGNGEFLCSVAESHPRRNFLGIERSGSQARALWKKLERRRLQNVRLLHADARCLVGLLPDACVLSYFVFFPDPWWKRRHRPRRLWSPELVVDLQRTLTPGGTIEFRTDVAEYFWATQAVLDAHPGLGRANAGPTEEGPSTSFFRKARRRGDTIYGSTHHCRR